jgi:hypothetical protein
MTDPLINQYVVQGTVRVSVVGKIDELGLSDVLIALLSRPDLELTSMSVKECTRDTRCKQLVQSSYATKQATYKRMLQVVGILNGVSGVEGIVLAFLL